MRSGRATCAFLLALGLPVSCVPEVGEQGPTGPQGPAGPMGATGNVASNFPDCPIGYVRDQSVMTIVLCKEGADEVVKVGRKGSAFWIDRYEASVWQNEDGSGQQFGATMDDYPSSFPKTGQYATPLYAVSRKDQTPSQFITWFQAQAACSAAGKRLPSRNEWLEAARGTLDLGEQPGTGGVCVTKAPGPRTTGGGTQCRSRWGAEDMIGNLTEWTDEWYAGIANGVSMGVTQWPAAFAGDLTANIGSSAYSEGSFVQGIPSAALRGGDHTHGKGAGIFFLDLNAAPTYFGSRQGFRCVVPH